MKKRGKFVPEKGTKGNKGKTMIGYIGGSTLFSNVKDAKRSVKDKYVKIGKKRYLKLGVSKVKIKFLS